MIVCVHNVFLCRVCKLHTCIYTVSIPYEPGVHLINNKDVFVTQPRVVFILLSIILTTSTFICCCLLSQIV